MPFKLQNFVYYYKSYKGGYYHPGTIDASQYIIEMLWEVFSKGLMCTWLSCSTFYVYESYVKVKVYIFYKIKKIKILMSSLHFFILLNIAISYNMMMFTWTEKGGGGEGVRCIKMSGNLFFCSLLSFRLFDEEYGG